MRGSDCIRQAARAALAGAVLLWGTCAAWAETPQRVVSINLCTDQLAMLVAAEGQLFSVSRLAFDTRMSAMVAQAGAYQVNRGQAEEIYLMRPDLVVAGRFSSRATVSMLERLGIPVVLFDLTHSLDGVRDQLAKMGEVLNQPARAAALIADFDARLAAYRTEVAERPRAALYYANGYTSGDKSLAHHILTTAGLENAIIEAGYSAGGIIPLEVLALTEPDTVITSPAYPRASRAEEVMAHPVIQTLRETRPEVAMTSSDWVCGTPFVLRAIDDMVTLRRQMQANAP